MSERRAKASFLVAELIVVLLGVLIALGVDSWWEGLEDRDRERAYLEAIRTDLAETVEALDSGIHSDSVSQIQMDSLGAVLGAPGDRDTEGWGRLLAFTLSYQPLNLGTLEALIQTGDIGLIQSERLRAELIAAAGRLSRGQEGLAAVLSRAGVNTREFVLELQRINLQSESPEDVLALASRSSVFSGSVLMHSIYLQNQLRILRDMRAAAAAVTDAIDEALERR